MNWKKTQMTEPQQRAQSIYDNMGKVEGNVHILQLQFFCDQLKHDLLIKYWKEVADHFATIKPTRKDWL
jgi:hypothetical protein